MDIWVFGGAKKMNRGYFYVLIAVLLFTFVPVFARILLPYINVESMTFFRFMFAVIALIIISSVKKVRIFKRIDRKEAIAYAGLGIIYVLVVYTYTLAVSYIHIANVQFLQQTSPVFTFIFAYLFLRESVKRSLYYSLIIAMSGAFIIFYFSASSIFGNQFIGNILAFVSGIFLAGYTTLSRHIGRKYPTLQATTWAFIFGSIFMSFSLFNVPDLSVSNWILLILFGIFATAMPFLLYVKSMEYIEAQKASLLLLLTVVTTPVAAFLFFQEIPSLASFIGGSLILLSSAIVLKK